MKADCYDYGSGELVRLRPGEGGKVEPVTCPSRCLEIGTINVCHGSDQKDADGRV